MQKINTASVSKRSFYIINKNRADIILARASALYKLEINNYWSTNVGIQIAKDKIHHSNVIDNLLGGQFYYNYNGWVIDDGLINSFQNNIQSPDQKIKEGDLIVPSGSKEGMVLYKPNSTPFVKGMETLSKTGYNIYKSKEGNVFYAFKAGETVDTEGLDLYFDAVRPNEDPALYNRRFNATFGSTLINNKIAETIKSTVRSMVGAAAPIPIEASFQKQTVLP
jgi:hypothetical protein